MDRSDRLARDDVSDSVQSPVRDPSSGCQVTRILGAAWFQHCVELAYRSILNGTAFSNS